MTHPSTKRVDSPGRQSRGYDVRDLDDIYDVVVDFVNQEGRVPSYGELKDLAGLPNASVARRYLIALEREGRIRMRPTDRLRSGKYELVDPISPLLRLRRVQKYARAADMVIAAIGKAGYYECYNHYVKCRSELVKGDLTD
jgi:SOS-response transcriptional repressor LexA